MPRHGSCGIILVAGANCRPPIEPEEHLSKKRSKQLAKARTRNQRFAIRRRSRLPMYLVLGLTALASLALVVAGFLSYMPR